ncbi:hypothetical protein J6590_047069 [Homalodisca vitripennis]|nr:hypothetical protein J6590_047069 [Homalodisca vitripennis]
MHENFSWQSHRGRSSPGVGWGLYYLLIFWNISSAEPRRDAKKEIKVDRNYVSGYNFVGLFQFGIFNNKVCPRKNGLRPFLVGELFHWFILILVKVPSFVHVLEQVAARVTPYARYSVIQSTYREDELKSTTPTESNNRNPNRIAVKSAERR